MGATDTVGTMDYSAPVQAYPDYDHYRASNFEPPHDQSLSSIRSADTALMVARGELPGFTIQNSDESNIRTIGTAELSADAASSSAEAKAQADRENGEQWYSGTLRVASALAEGGWDELTEHPLRVLGCAAFGAAATVGISLLAPPVALAVGAAALLYGAYELVDNVPDWVHDATVVANPEDYSAAEHEKAHAGLRDLGAGTVDLAAGVAGGIGAGMLMAPKTAVAQAAATADDSVAQAASTADDAVAQAASTADDVVAQAASTTDDVVAQGASTVDDAMAQATTITDDAVRQAITAETSADTAAARSAAGRTATAAETTASETNAARTAAAEAKVTEAPVAAPPAAPAVAPEVAESVARTQGIFNAAGKSEAVIPMEKQLYNVRFERVTEPGGRLVPTLENRAGELVQQGQYIATRLDAAGKPVIEDGVVNSWGIKLEKLMKTYEAPPVQPETTAFVAQTRVGGPSVHMVQLREPITIKTPWGEMSGKAGDWLANYDFHAATGTPGIDFAIVTARSYSQTYKPAL